MRLTEKVLLEGLISYFPLSTWISDVVKNSVDDSSHIIKKKSVTLMISLSLKQATIFRILESFDDTLENVRDDKVL